MPTVFTTADVTLPSDSEVLVRRTFAAPRHLVYAAYTQPALLRRWMLGPPGWSMPICDMDVRPGGQYRWGWQSEDGTQSFGFHGTFEAVEPGVRLVHSEHFDPGTTGQPQDDGPGARVTTTFEEHAGTTTVAMRVDYGTKEVRDAVLATGMTDGMEHGHARLDALIAEGAIG